MGFSNGGGFYQGNAATTTTTTASTGPVNTVQSVDFVAGTSGFLIDGVNDIVQFNNPIVEFTDGYIAPTFTPVESHDTGGTPLTTTSATYAPLGSNANVGFTWPTSGNLEVTITSTIYFSGGTRQFGDYGIVSFELYQGTDATGTLIQAASDDNAVINEGPNGQITGSQTRVFTTGNPNSGPGFARAMFRYVNNGGGGQTAEFIRTTIVVTPCP